MGFYDMYERKWGERKYKKYNPEEEVYFWKDIYLYSVKVRPVRNMLLLMYFPVNQLSRLLN